jgi:hypothetical protein
MAPHVPPEAATRSYFLSCRVGGARCVARPSRGITAVNERPPPWLPALMTHERLLASVAPP